MIVLDATTQSIEIKMSGAPATTNPSYLSTYADNNGTLFTEGAEDGALNGTTQVTVVSAPGASVRRVIKDVVVYNEDTAAVTITVRLNNNGTYRNLYTTAIDAKGTWTLSGSGSSGSATSISDVAYAGSWDSVVDVAPSKNAVYDKINSMPQSFATAAEDLAGAESTKAITPFINQQLIRNLKPAVNAAVNKLDIFTKSGGAVPDATNIISVAIPDGNGYTFRSRSAAYLSGTGQFILADGQAYWGAVSGTDKIKLHIYEIWDANGGIVHALSRYAGFDQVPTTTTVGDDDYFLLEAGSTYTRAATDHCVAVGHVWGNYNTANTPDWTIYQESDGAALAPQVIWNPKSDYVKSATLAATYTQASDIIDQSFVNFVVKQSGLYSIPFSIAGADAGVAGYLRVKIKVGSSIYGSAIQKLYNSFPAKYVTAVLFAVEGANSINIYLNAGDTVHLGVELFFGAGGEIRTVYGDNTAYGATSLKAIKND